MLVMRTIENSAYPIRKLVGSQQPLWLDDLALAVHPLGLYGVQPRALLRQKTAYDPHSGFAPTLLDTAVVLAQPAPYLFGDVPGSVVPDEEQNLLANSLEPFATPLKESGRYATDGSAIHEPDPRLVEFGQVESVAGDGLWVGIVLGDRLLNEAKGLSFLTPTVQSGQCQPTPPAFVLEAHCPGLGVVLGHFHQPVAPAFFLSYKGSGEVIHRLARIHLTPSRRESVARTVSPETRLWVSPSSKAASAAISKVQRLLSYPNSLGDRWSISRKASALLSSKAAWTSLGREEPGVRARRPRSLKAWMAFLTVCEPHPRLRAIFGGESPRELARSIWLRRITKASLERNPAWRLSRSFSESERTNIGGFMPTTIAHHTQSSVKSRGFCNFLQALSFLYRSMSIAPSTSRSWRRCSSSSRMSR